MSPAPAGAAPASPCPLSALRALLAKEGFDGLVVTRFDAHQTPYCPPHEERLAFLTGFTGSAGLALILPDRVRLFVDGRYQVQARQESDLALVDIGHLIDTPPGDWLKQNLGPGRRIACNPLFLPAAWLDPLRAGVSAAGSELVLSTRDFAVEIWPARPAPALNPVYPCPPEIAGESVASKRARVAAAIAAAGADFLIETQPDNIAWLLNLRGGDAAFNPMPQSFLFIDRSGAVEWLIDPRKVPNDLAPFELEGVRRGDPAGFLARIAALGGARAALVDPDLAPAAAEDALEAAGGQAIRAKSPISLIKTRKNAVELAGFRACHLEDGAAWCAFLAWLETEVPRRAAAGNPVGEFEAETRLLALKRARGGFVESSFRTISAFGPNAAMCHYHAPAAGSALLRPDGLYLLDSGSHYLNGTTDATRTLAFGPQPGEIRRAYTAVLRALISMLTLRFPDGTMGHQIDAFARRPLWDLGLDFDHGTGHSVGHCLSVHEYPHRFSKKANSFPLEAGMVMTIEPGHYIEGQYGIRIENTVEIVRRDDGFLAFESLTMIPIETRILEPAALTPAECGWIDAYNAGVHARLAPLLDSETRHWLEARTRAGLIGRA